MQKISIESSYVTLVDIPITDNDITTEDRHLYLVYEDSGGEEYVIRGAPSSINSNLIGVSGVSKGKPLLLNKSGDARGSDTPEDRGSRDIIFGDRDLADVWSIMKQQGANIANANLDYNSGIFGNAQNSNSVVSSLLFAVGIDVNKNIPLGKAADRYVGKDNVLSFDTTLPGSSSSDIIQGAGGKDIIGGNEGNDTLAGGAEQDTLIGGTGSDRYIANSGDLIFGGKNDQIEFFPTNQAVNFYVNSDDPNQIDVYVDGEIDAGNLGVLVDGETDSEGDLDNYETVQLDSRGAAINTYLTQLAPLDYEATKSSGEKLEFDLIRSKATTFQVNGTVSQPVLLYNPDNRPDLTANVGASRAVITPFNNIGYYPIMHDPAKDLTYYNFRIGTVIEHGNGSGNPQRIYLINEDLSSPQAGDFGINYEYLYYNPKTNVTPLESNEVFYIDDDAAWEEISGTSTPDWIKEYTDPIYQELLAIGQSAGFELVENEADSSNDDVPGIEDVILLDEDFDDEPLDDFVPLTEDEVDQLTGVNESSYVLDPIDSSMAYRLSDSETALDQNLNDSSLANGLYSSGSEAGNSTPVENLFTEDIIGWNLSDIDTTNLEQTSEVI